MNSVRTRMSSLLRRSSVISDKGDRDSGSERESSRPPSREGSLRKGSGEGKRRKRVSFSMRGRSGTADTQEQSQLAKSVVSATVAESADKPVVAAVDTTTESTPAYTKTDSPVDGTQVSKLDVKVENASAEEVAVSSAEQQLPVDAPIAVLTEEVSIAAPVEVQITEHVDEVKPSDLHEAAQATDASNTESNVKTGSIEVPFDVVMKDSPSHSMIEVEKRVPASETAPYDTSFTSTSSAAGPSASLSMPVPRSTGQPLSAIDELRAKGHPLAEWVQKDDVNYDADREEYVRVMTLFFLLPAVIFLGLPYIFSVPAVHDLVSM